MNENFEKMLNKYGIETYSGCVEPGYDDKPVALGNWNNIPEKVSKALEFMGYEIEWEDEWTSCGGCGKLVRTSPNSYGWSQYFAILNDCELICGDCLKQDPSEYLESIENNPKQCVTIEFDLEAAGYTKWEDGFENGLHENMNDNPTEILKDLLVRYPKGKFIFNLDEPSQFYIGFSVWKKNEDIEE